jgi:hypothetical protein
MAGHTPTEQLREAEHPLQATQLDRDTAVLEQLLDDRL